MRHNREREGTGCHLPTPRQYLGGELSRARIAAGFKSQQAFANRLGFHRSVIAKAESGERVPSADVLAAWCEATGVAGDHFGRMAEMARSASDDSPIPPWFEEWLEAEGKADHFRLWQPSIVPGLFQVPDYMRALFIAAGDDEAKAGERVSARVGRQAILSRLVPPRLVAVLDEMVLRRLIGAPGIMHDQLAHLAALSDLPNVMIQVVPSVRGGTGGLSGGFAIASGDGMRDTLRMEALEDVTEKRRPLVGRAALVFDQVRGQALPFEESRALIVEAAEEWNRR